MLLNRQESHADRILARCRQLNSEGCALACKKLMRNLNQHTSAVAGFRIAAACAAMCEIYQDLNSLLDDPMALLAANAGYKTHSASVVLVRGIVETLRRRQTILCFPKLQWISPEAYATAHTRSCVYLWYRDRRVKVQFRISIRQMEILRNRESCRYSARVRAMRECDHNFFD